MASLLCTAALPGGAALRFYHCYLASVILKFMTEAPREAVSTRIRIRLNELIPGNELHPTSEVSFAAVASDKLKREQYSRLGEQADADGVTVDSSVHSSQDQYDAAVLPSQDVGMNDFEDVMYVKN